VRPSRKFVIWVSFRPCPAYTFHRQWSRLYSFFYWKSKKCSINIHVSVRNIWIINRHVLIIISIHLVVKESNDCKWRINEHWFSIEFFYTYIFFKFIIWKIIFINWFCSNSSVFFSWNSFMSICIIFYKNNLIIWLNYIYSFNVNSYKR